MTLLIYQGITYAAPPTFDDGDEKTVSVSENTAIDTEIVRLPVTDPDNDIGSPSWLETLGRVLATLRLIVLGLRLINM